MAHVMPREGAADPGNLRIKVPRARTSTTRSSPPGGGGTSVFLRMTTFSTSYAAPRARGYVNARGEPAARTRVGISGKSMGFEKGIA